MTLQYFQTSREMLNVEPLATAQQVNAQSLDIVGEIVAANNNINIVMAHQPTEEQIDDLNQAFKAYGKPVALLGGRVSLMVNNAKHLTNRDIQCFAATTERKSVEVINEDGTTTKKSIFSYVTLRPINL